MMRARTYLTVAGTASLAVWLLGVARVGGWAPLHAGYKWVPLGLGVAFLGAGRIGARDG